MKRISNKKVLFAMLVASLLVLGTLASCTSTHTLILSGTGTATLALPTATPTVGVTDDPTPVSPSHSLPYDGRTVTVLVPGGVRDFSFGEIDDVKAMDDVEKALFWRVATVEDRLKIKLAFTYTEVYDPTGEAQYVTQVGSKSAAGTPYDALFVYNTDVHELTVRGLAANLRDAHYVAPKDPWWDQAYLQATVSGDSFYSLLESSSYSTIRSVNALFFNEELMTKLGYGFNAGKNSLYSIAAAGNWTQEKFYEIAKELYVDDGDGVVEITEDRFGFCSAVESPLRSWFYASGNRLTSVNSRGMQSFLSADQQTSFINRFATYFASDAFATEDPAPYDAFAQGRAAFYLSTLGMVENYLYNDAFLEILGVVPLPKANEGQQKYYSTLSGPYPVWMIPAGVANMDVSSATLEVMAAEAYRQVKPVYLDKCLSEKWAPNEDFGEMYDLIMKGITFDMAIEVADMYGYSTPMQAIESCVLHPETEKWSTWSQNYTDQHNWSEALRYYQACMSQGGK